MSIVTRLKPLVATALKELYDQHYREDDLTVTITKPEFEGDYTLVLFSLIKQLRKSPEQLGKELGENLVASEPALFTSYNVIKGFLNLVVADDYYTQYLTQNFAGDQIGKFSSTGKNIMVEYSSPNTNKPLHLGHLRNNFLGWSVAEILRSSGNQVMKTCIVNDRGIHICKSMIAWQLFGNGDTPQSTGIKGDHFVGDYYVKFNNEHKDEMQDLIAAGQSKEEAERNAPIMKKTQQMLVD